MAVEPSDFSDSGTEHQFDGNHPIPLLASTITAFIGRCQRGPLNEAVLIQSFDDYRHVFGGHCPFSFVSHAVQHYFLHGGHAAIVVRLANRARRAALDLPAGEGLLRLQAVQPGSHEFLRASVDYDGIEEDDRKFNLVIQRVARPGSQLVEDQELHRSLSMDESDDKFVVDALRGSDLVRLSGPLPPRRPDATLARNPGDPIPYVDMSSGGSDGEELTDYDVIGSNTEGTGLFALEVARGVDLLCIPSPPSGHDLGSTALLAAERYCRQRRAMLILDPPSTWRSPETALLGIRTSSFASRNAITYFPRLQPRDGAERFPHGLPACGVMAGLLAHNDRRGVWHALDERTGQLRSGLSPVAGVDERQAAMLQRQGINVFSRSDVGGFGLHGNVTMAGPHNVSSLWQRLDRRRLAFFVLGTVQRCTWWALDEPRDEALWMKLERQVTTFLLGLHAQGALPGERAEQAFFVKVGPEIQPDEKTLVVRVGFALEKPNQFLIYDITHRADGSEARALPPLEAAQLAG